MTERDRNKSGNAAEDAGAEAGLEALFDDARRSPPAPSRALLARIEADARALQPPVRGAVTGAGGRLRGWWRLLGGAPGIGGLATSAVLGFWIGFAPPAALDALDDSLSPLTGAAGEVNAALPEDGFGWTMAEAEG